MITWDNLAKQEKTFHLTPEQRYRHKVLPLFFKNMNWQDLTREERRILDSIRDRMFKGIPVTEKQFKLVRYLAIMSNGGSKPNNPIYVIENVYRKRT